MKNNDYMFKSLRLTFSSIGQQNIVVCIGNGLGSEVEMTIPLNGQHDHQLNDVIFFLLNNLQRTIVQGCATLILEQSKQASVFLRKEKGHLYVRPYGKSGMALRSLISYLKFLG